MLKVSQISQRTIRRLRTATPKCPEPDPRTDPVKSTRLRNHIFDPVWYETTYPDVRTFPGPAFEHFRQYGFLEGRHPCNLSAVVEEHYGAEASRALILDFARLGIDVVDAKANTDGEKTTDASRDYLECFADSIAIPHALKPRVSIVVPHFGKVHLTLACVGALSRLKTLIGFEVILVSDGGSDEHQAILKRVAGVRHHNLSSNSGFLRAANEGAELARGDVIVFLNNDCFVLPEWLDEIVTVFEAHPSAGIVGSQLIGETGFINECGGFILPDGHGVNFGRGSVVGASDTSFLRHADYVSGASLAVRTQVWKDLGGFSSEFLPAYYEDTDLCFQAKRAGWSVYVQPASRAVHIEGSTAGRNVLVGAKQSQESNRLKFAAKWSPVLLSKRGLRTSDDSTLSSRRASEGNVLVIDALVPDAGRDAGSVFTTELLRTLVHMGWTPTFGAAYESLARKDNRVADWGRQGVDILVNDEFANPIDVLSRRPHLYEAVIVFRHNVLMPMYSDIRLSAPHAKLLFFPADLHFIRERRLLESGCDLISHAQIRVSRDSELFLANRCDQTVVHSTTEVEVLESEVHGTASISLLPWILKGVRRQAEPPASHQILFVGSHQHLPNPQAVDWFLERVWPVVSQRVPSARFVVVGSGIPTGTAQGWTARGALVAGHVADLDPLYASSRVVVAPLLTGSGFKGKVAEAMANGVPCVGTSLAFEGMNVEPGRHVLAADDAVAFASEIVRLLLDDGHWKIISGDATSFAQSHWSREAASRSLARLLRGTHSPTCEAVGKS